MILGAPALDKLRRSHVAVFGLGGVGSYAAECLARSGVGTLTLVDQDTVSVSNLNRQLCALTSTVGQYKAEVAAARVRDIDPDTVVYPICATYDAAHREEFFSRKFDYIVDCIDLVSCKLDLIQQARLRGIPILSALGTGNKLEPELLRVTDPPPEGGVQPGAAPRDTAAGSAVTRTAQRPRQCGVGALCGRPDDGRHGGAGYYRRWRSCTMILTGALVNGGAIVVGGLLGTFGGKLMPEKMRQTVLGATALVSMGIGISGAIGSSNQLIPILSLVIGAVIGELLHIDDGVTRAGDWLQKKFGKMGPITDGFVSGSLVFAVGAMAVMGSLDSGLKNDHGILLAKSVIDFAGSVAFASSMGIGIVFSGLSVLAVEGVMTLLASLLTGVLTDAVITEISVTGSLLIIGIGLNVLGLTKLRIMNMTPALLLPVLLCKFM